VSLARVFPSYVGETDGGSLTAGLSGEERAIQQRPTIPTHQGVRWVSPGSISAVKTVTRLLNAGDGDDSQVDNPASAALFVGLVRKSFNAWSRLMSAPRRGTLGRSCYSQQNSPRCMPMKWGSGSYPRTRPSLSMRQHPTAWSRRRHIRGRSLPLAV